MPHNVLVAFALTLFAGLSTGIGSAVAFVGKRTDKRLLSGALGFSAGVMIYVSFVEILKKSREALVLELGAKTGSWAAVGAFFGGILLIAIIDRMVPSFENPHEAKLVKGLEDHDDEQRLLRMGFFSALAIGIHNFPEGLATFAAALKDPTLGVGIAIAIAIHNIPEGIAVSAPIYYATGSRKKAFVWSFVSGLAEPVGALVGYLLLYNLFTDVTFGILFGAVGGIMVYISLDELLPTAEEYGHHHVAIYGLLGGMAVMALSLLLFL